MKVRVNSLYMYVPCLLDRIDGRTSLKHGDVVRVINVYGCPKANTMGHCYVGDAKTGKFIGMVCTSSLIKPFDLSKCTCENNGDYCEYCEENETARELHFANRNSEVK